MGKKIGNTNQRLLKKFDHLREIVQKEDLPDTDWKCAMICPFTHRLNDIEAAREIDNISEEKRFLNLGKLLYFICKITNEYTFYNIEFVGKDESAILFKKKSAKKMPATIYPNMLGDSKFSIVLPDISSVFCGGFDYSVFLYYKGYPDKKFLSLVNVSGLFVLDQQTGKLLDLDRE